MKGYVKDKDGHILVKLDLPSGREHKLNLKAGEVFVTATDLSKVEVYQPPETEGEKREKLIQGKIREIAIKELVKEGKIL